MRTIEWDESNQILKIIDQRQLPAKFEYIYLDNYKAIAESIRNMAVRGAPVIGVTAAYGMVLAGLHSPAQDPQAFMADLQMAAKELNDARPTAVNLPWALKRMVCVVEGKGLSVSEMKAALLAEAHAMAEEDIRVNKAISKNGAPLIADGDTIIHHCNTGALATVDWGTALGVIRYAFEEGKHIHVLVDETRPRLQGARLTAWELKQMGIPFDIISDNMAGYFLSTGQVQKVFFGRTGSRPVGMLPTRSVLICWRLPPMIMRFRCIVCFLPQPLILSLSGWQTDPIENGIRRKWAFLSKAVCGSRRGDRSKPCF